MAIKQNVKNVFKVSRKTFFNPSAWIGANALADQFKSTTDVIKDVITVPTPKRQETFEQAMQRFNLTDDDIKKIEQRYLIYSLIFLICGGLALVYGFYLLILQRTLLGWIFGMSVTALLLAQAFRFHFWHFQIKHKKLGCTFAEWKRGKPFGDGES